MDYAGSIEAFLKCRQMEFRHRHIGDDGDALAPQKRLQMSGRICDEPAADQKVVFPVAEIDGNLA